MTAHRSKPIPRNPELEKKLAEARIAWDAMTCDEKEEMLLKQRESWSRQDMD
jgi:hypothetical protein